YRGDGGVEGRAGRLRPARDARVPSPPRGPSWLPGLLRPQVGGAEPRDVGRAGDGAGTPTRPARRASPRVVSDARPRRRPRHPIPRRVEGHGRDDPRRHIGRRPGRRPLAPLREPRGVVPRRRGLHPRAPARRRVTGPDAGRRAASVLQAHDVDTVFTLNGGHLWPLYYGCAHAGGTLIDTR